MILAHYPELFDRRRLLDLARVGVEPDRLGAMQDLADEAVRRIEAEAEPAIMMT